MPNWVYNNLSISGFPAVVKEVKQQLSKKYITQHLNYLTGDIEKVESDSPLSFWNIIAPTDIDNYYDQKDKDQSHPNHWYKWNTANWGTKWDACEVEVVEEDIDFIAYKFNTAWSYPESALLLLSEQYPELEISLDWLEEQGFGGTIEFTNGQSCEVSSYEYKCWECDEIYSFISLAKFDEDGQHKCEYKMQAS